MDSEKLRQGPRWRNGETDTIYREREREDEIKAERERVREMERQMEAEGGDRRDWPMAAPSSHTWGPQQMGSSFLCLEIPVCTPRVPQKWQWAPILSPRHQLPIRPWLARWHEPFQLPGA